MSSLSVSGLSFSGLASGIDTNSIINALTQFGQNQIQNLQNNSKQISTQQAAVQDIESKLLDLQNKAQSLSQSVNGVLDARTVTPSDPTLVSGAASSSAVPGVYTFTINQLAQAQQLASQGFDSTTSTIAQGTYQLRVGNGATTTVTVDGTNNTLQGLASAINNAHGDVSAAVISDGSGTQPFRLLLTSNKTGAANALAVTFTPGSGGGVSAEFNATTINDAVAAVSNTSTAAVSSNASAGAYTGTTNNTYTFTVANGGDVSGGTVTLNYTDSTGANHGTITVDGTGQPQAVAQGLQISVGSGQLVTGDTFTVDAFMPNVQQAADASVTLGSGPGALTVKSSSNQVSNLISGVTLNLLGANPTTPVSLTVASDVTGAAAAVQDFVTSYNALIGDISSQTSFDPTTSTAGPLLGNSDVTSIENQVSSAALGVVVGLGSQANRLSAIGVTVGADGTLSVDTDKLNQALSGQLPGVSSSDIKRLFALTGTADNAGVQFVAGSTRTAASAGSYQVKITQAATQASLTATNALAASVTIDGTNNTFALNVNGRNSAQLTLASGTFTPTQLAQQVQNAINNDTALGGTSVAVTVNGGKLQITSQQFGSNSTVSVGGGSALTALGLTGTESGTGKNVAGSFVVNGVSEQATGIGQLLTGSSGNAHTAGLVVSVSLSDAQVQAGDNTANVTVTRGIASALDQTLANFLDPVNGRLKAIDDSFQSQIDDINKLIAEDNQQLTDRKNQLLQQFAAMEAAVSSQLKIQGQAIAAAFAGANSSRSSGGTSSGGSSSSS